MNSIRRLLIACLVLFSAVSVSAQYSFNRISKDTLVAGESNEVLVAACHMGACQLVARLTPDESIDPQLCPDCQEDTIWGEQIYQVQDTIYSITFNIPLGTYPARYHFELWEENGGGYWIPDITIISKPYIVSQPKGATYCPGDTAELSVLAYEPERINYQWFHDNQPVESTGPTLSLAEIQMNDTGSYYCILSNQWGEDTTDMAMLDIPPLPEAIGMPAGPGRLCKTEGNTFYTLPVTEEVSAWNWVLIPGSAGLLEQSDTLVSIDWDGSFIGTAGLFAETVLDQCPGPNSDTLEILVSGPSFIPEICIIGIEENTGKYCIVWNKLPDESIVAYNIYRESNQAGIFMKLDSVPVDNFSVYVDSFSVPEEVSHSYKISYVDTCGLESDYSPVHSTIHLSANLGTNGRNNLLWSPYEGFAFLTYTILRGLDPDTLQYFQEVSSNVTSYSDTDPPTGNVYYQIAVSRDGQCNPSTKSDNDYSVAKSNIVNINTTGTGPDYIDQLDIYPNPAREYVKVLVPDRESYSSARLSVSTLAGKQIISFYLDDDVVTIPTTDLNNGIYLIRLETDRNTLIRKLIILK